MEIFLFFIILTITMMALGMLLTNRRRDMSGFIKRTPFGTRPMGGIAPRAFDSWRYGNWFVGERLNDAINAGKQHNASKRSPRGHQLSRQHRKHHH